MTATTRCGLWRDRSCTIAVVLDTEGHCQRIAPPPENESECWDWLLYLGADHGLDVELALPESMVTISCLPRLAVENGIPVWLVPDKLLDAIRAVAFARQRRPWVATLLARIPDVRAWRPHLRRLLSSRDPRQLLLL